MGRILDFILIAAAGVSLWLLVNMHPCNGRETIAGVIVIKDCK